MKINVEIISNPEILGGKPVIAGTRISVEWVLLKLREGLTLAEILDEYPHLKADQLQAAIDYACRLAARPAYTALPRQT